MGTKMKAYRTNECATSRKYCTCVQFFYEVIRFKADSVN